MGGRRSVVGMSWTLADTRAVHRLGSVEGGGEVDGSFSVKYVWPELEMRYCSVAEIGTAMYLSTFDWGPAWNSGSGRSNSWSKVKSASSALELAMRSRGSLGTDAAGHSQEFWLIISLPSAAGWKTECRLLLACCNIPRSMLAWPFRPFSAGTTWWGREDEEGLWTGCCWRRNVSQVLPRLFSISWTKK